MTGLSVIKAALRMLGTLAEGQTPSASEVDDALEALNAMLDSWSTRRVSLYASQYAEYTLQTAIQSYSIGSGGTFNQARPVKIIAIDALIADAGGTPATDKARSTIELISVEQWAAIKPRNAKATFPTACYPDYAFPLCNLNFWPVPTFTGTAPKVEIYQWTALTRFPDTSSSYTVPEGYELAFKANLAVLLAPEYNMVASQELMKAAQESYTALTTLNLDNLSPGGTAPPMPPSGP
jgi:hypothetical protein